MDRNALDWLFSTAPQALAALVGLIFTGVAFIHGAIDKEIDQDDTSKEILENMKKDIHSNMKWLFWLAGVSIIADLILIILNPIEEGRRFSFAGSFDLYLLVAAVVLLINLITLFFSLWFIIRVANPNYFKRTVKKMAEETKGGDIEAKDYIAGYIELEKALRDLPLNANYCNPKPPSVPEILKEIKYRGLLKQEDVNALFELNKLRNLIVHGAEIKYVENKRYQQVTYYVELLKNLKKEL